MSTSVKTSQAQQTSAQMLPGAALLKRTLWLLVVATVASLVYSALVTGSKSGGVAGNTSADQHTVTIVTHPNPAMYVIFATIVFGAIVLVLRRAHDEEHALKILTRAMLVVASVAAVAIIVGYTWLSATLLSQWVEPGVHVFPYPFLTADVTTSPN